MYVLLILLEALSIIVFFVVRFNGHLIYFNTVTKGKNILKIIMIK